LKTYLIIPDLHIPFHCPKYLKLVTKILKHLRPNGIVQLGDALDFWQLSTYDKDPARKNTIGDDIAEWNAVIGQWMALLPRNGEIHLLEGNHEFRLHRYVARHARDLHEIVRPLPSLLNIKERNAASSITVKWHPYTKWSSCRIGDCTLLHGFYFNAHVAATNLAKYRTNVICGHTHRLQHVADGVHYSVTLGHASDEIQTAHQPTPTGWTQALAILTVDDAGKTGVEVITVNQGKAVVRGKSL
jgi:predicted phosphodiesterase